MAARLWLQDMSWPEVQAKVQQTNIVLVPVGSTEQHGPHLPLGVDTFIPIHAAELISKRTGVPIAPPVWWAPCEWHMGFSGTISVRPTTLIALFTDICKSLYRHGFRHFLFVNGHTSGYNPAILSAADEIQAQLPELHIWVLDVFEMAQEAALSICKAELLYHGDELEGSQMLAARPDLVDMSKAKKVTPPAPLTKFMAYNYRATGDRVLTRFSADVWKKISSDGHVGDPTLATKEKGDKIVGALVENAATLIADLKKARP
jgi:creatinine amidohydrolase